MAKQPSNEGVKIEQQPDKILPPLGEPWDDDDRKTVATPAGGYDEKANHKYYKDLQFMEEPVKIVLSAVHGDKANCTDLIAVNGKWAELLVNGQWLPVGYLPKGGPIVTKRKYLDVILRSKGDEVQTHMDKLPDGDIQNRVSRTTYGVHTVQVLEDKNPAGAEWLLKRSTQNFG